MIDPLVVCGACTLASNVHITRSNMHRLAACSENMQDRVIGK